MMNTPDKIQALVGLFIKCSVIAELETFACIHKFLNYEN